MLPELPIIISQSSGKIPRFYCIEPITLAGFLYRQHESSATCGSDDIRWAEHGVFVSSLPRSISWSFNVNNEFKEQPTMIRIQSGCNPTSSRFAQARETLLFPGRSPVSGRMLGPKPIEFPSKNKRWGSKPGDICTPKLTGSNQSSASVRLVRRYERRPRPGTRQSDRESKWQTVPSCFRRRK